MKPYLFIFTFAALLAAGCGRGADEAADRTAGERRQTGEGRSVPDGYFVVNFAPSVSRAPVSGSDTRIRNLRYLLFRADGTFVKERVVVDSDAAVTWPLAAPLADTLPGGVDYRAVFLANMPSDDLLTVSRTATAADYAASRIGLPGVEFTDVSQYYMANVAFSDTAPPGGIVLRRILSAMSLHRNAIDDNAALAMLLTNIRDNVDFGDLVSTTVAGLLTPEITDILDGLSPAGTTILNTALLALGGTLDDVIVNPIVDALVAPITDALLADGTFVPLLTARLEEILEANVEQEGIVTGSIGELLNPWATADLSAAVVTIDDFPRTIDLDMNVRSTWPAGQRFGYTFASTPATYDEKDIVIMGLDGAGGYDIRNINVTRTGLVGGVVIDDVAGGLLTGMFVDITDPLTYAVPMNRKYGFDYSLLDLGLTSYSPATAGDGQPPLQLGPVDVGDVANVADALNGLAVDIPLLGPLVTFLLSDVLNDLNGISIDPGINLPVLGVDNLAVGGGWSSVPQELDTTPMP